MTLIRTLAAAFSLLLINSLIAQNTWIPFEVGASVQTITTLGDSIYVSSYGSGGGILRSVNDGLDWQPAISGIPNNLVRSVGRSGGYLFAGHSTGIYRSADGGSSWQLMNSGIPAGVTYATKFFDVGGVTLAVFSGNIMDGGGIYRSTNNGTSWSMGHSGMSSNLTVNHLAFDQTGIYAATSVGIYHSSNGAVSWQVMGSVNYHSYSLQIVGQRIIAITTFGVIRTDNYGGTWSTPAIGIPSTPSRGELVAYDGKLYASIGSGPGSSSVYRSLDNGVSFTEFENGLSASDQLNQNQFHASHDRLYLGALTDVYWLPGSTVGISDQRLNGSKIYPTLFDGGFTVDLAGEAAGSEFVLIGIDGKKAAGRTVHQSSFYFERGTLAAGTYQCMLIDPITGTIEHLGQVIAQ